MKRAAPAMLSRVDLALVALGALAVLGALGMLAGACQDQSASNDVTRELARIREEQAAQRARIDGVIDRIERLEIVLAQEGDTEASDDASDARLVRSQTALGDPASVPAGGGAPDAVPFVVAVGQRTLAVGDDKVDPDALAQRLRAHAESSPHAPVVLRIAAGVSSGRMTEIADMAREQGVTQLAVVHEGTAKKEKKRKKRRR